MVHEIANHLYKRLRMFAMKCETSLNADRHPLVRGLVDKCRISKTTSHDIFPTELHMNHPCSIGTDIVCNENMRTD